VFVQHARRLVSAVRRSQSPARSVADGGGDGGRLQRGRRLHEVSLRLEVGDCGVGGRRTGHSHHRKQDEMVHSPWLLFVFLFEVVWCDCLERLEYGVDSLVCVVFGLKIEACGCL